MVNPDNRRVVSASVIFSTRSDADAFCSYWTGGNGSAALCASGPNGFVVDFEDQRGSGSIAAFRQICAGHNATDCLVTSSVGSPDAPAADPFAQTLIDNLGPLLESLPTVMHGLEVAKAKVALRLHIQKAVADKLLGCVSATDTFDDFADHGKLAGKYAATFAGAMQNEIDLRELCDEELDEMESKPAA